ncbi:MAG: SNF2 helicase associated domain-containing protein [Lachnospiraceae bacterium]|nr:SNF2 helicase associated domain-containing protein [Lachnospiraceae bacterium]
MKIRKDWTDTFSPTFLSAGKLLYEHGRVGSLITAGKHLIATVEDGCDFRADAMIEENAFREGACTCLEGNMYGRCRHIAALLYAAIEDKENRERPEKQERKSSGAFSGAALRLKELRKETERQRQEERREAAERGNTVPKPYRYFDTEKILESVIIPPDIERKARQLLREDGVSRFSFSTGYLNYVFSGGMIGIVRAQTGRGAEKRHTEMQLNPDEVRYSMCGHASCGYDYSHSNRLCEHKAALLFRAIEYIEKNNPGDVTSRGAQALLQAISGSPSARAENEGTLSGQERGEIREEPLTLAPQLAGKGGRYTVSFSVGTGRLYKIKDLREFVQKCEEGDSMQFGKNTTFRLGENRFADDRSGEWFQFIRGAIAEEDTRASYLSGREKTGGRSVAGVPDEIRIKSDIALFGNQIDQFYTLAEGASIPLTITASDYDYRQKERKTLVTGENRPHTVLRLRAMNGKGGVLAGVSLSGSLPSMIYGQQADYFIEDNSLNRVDKSFAKAMEPLQRAVGWGGEVIIGRNHFSLFFRRVLPELKQWVEVEEPDKERIDACIPPEAVCSFFVDYDGVRVILQAQLQYGEDSYNPCDDIEEGGMVAVPAHRDRETELEVHQAIHEFFPHMDSAEGLFFSDSGEDALFRAAGEGVDRLLAFGEVHATKAFKEIGIVRNVKFRIGISMSEGLLELELLDSDVDPAELAAMVAAYRNKKQYYRLKNGVYVRLTENAGETVEELSQMLDTMGVSVAEFVRGKTKIPAYRALYLDRMLEEAEGVYAERDKRFRNLIKEFKTIEDAEDEPPQDISAIMRQYQVTGFQWMKTLDRNGFGGILADDMGLGKTLQAISVIASEKERKLAVGEKTQTSLVVCPASLVYNWGEECSRFAPRLKVLLVVGTAPEREKRIASYKQYDVLVTSYDLLKRDITHYEGKRFRFQFADEAQFIKTHTTAAAKSVKLISAQTRFALTGTPIENRLSELWSIMDYLMPGVLYTHDLFVRDFEHPILKEKDGRIREKLSRMVSSFILRRLKTDVLKDLPDKLEEVRFCALENEQKKLYDAQVIRMRGDIEGQDEAQVKRNKIEILAELTRIRRLCCDPSLLFENYRGTSAKRESCLDLIRSAMDGGHRMLVFSQFTTMLALLEEDLKKEKIAYYKITGQTSKEERAAQVRAFNTDETPVFLISLKAGGTGLNLTGADTVIHYDPWWNVAAQNQATDRAHRIGQERIVTVYKLIAKGTIEEKILKLQETKRQLAEDILSGESISEASIDREALLELLG